MQHRILIASVAVMAIIFLSGCDIINGRDVSVSDTISADMAAIGQISITDASISATEAKIAMIEGAHAISLTNTALIGAEEWGVMIYQRTSGGITGLIGSFTMSGGSLTAQNGPVFYVTNSTGVINLRGVSLSSASGTLLDTSAGNWGESDTNGGHAILTADHQALSGNVLVDASSTAAITLKNESSLYGAINTAHTAEEASLILDATSTWIVTGDSYLTVLSDSAGIDGSSMRNIIGNGHTVYYAAAANPDLAGATYTLSGGGTLTPAK
ncbi:MAG: hypothetical protein HGA65_04885 [Oscillochloris sp.]|nr:hypothetical protein [Oscillochloris sp.]